ncbi:hypothetical protein BP6252_12542 [Coleophoma cylindrospora]|uniref:Uncharacterized protein n=1 Tax=Coleophoma cylindrospora TaxID=1849047 RepID=A0A3D8QC68_9HELO|nr:hypothetical protein BP6252_12542 [Coleophoma cylindrospora]
MSESVSDQWGNRPLNDDDLEIVGQRLRSPRHRLKSRLATYFEGYMEFVEMPPSPSPTESDTDDMTESTEDERQSHPRSMSPPSEPSREQRKMDDHGVQRDNVDAHEYAILRRQLHTESKRNRPKKNRGFRSSRASKPLRKIHTSSRISKCNHPMLTRAQARSSRKKPLRKLDER